MMSEPTASQEKVIEYPYVPETTLKVIAGPGSGKTYTLLLKVRELIAKGTVRADEILILSLTNKAVDNIIYNLLNVFEEHAQKQHSTESFDETIAQIGIYTIHGLANRVVIENEGLINVIEENGWRGLIKLIPSDFLKKHTSNKRVNELTPRVFEKIFREYQTKGRFKNKDDTMEHILSIMKTSKVVTNEDLIMRAAKHLEEFHRPEPLSDMQFTQELLSKYKIVIIDEFQDLFPSLIPLLKILSRNKQLIMFGDPNQSVYDFLGDNREVLKALDTMRSSDNLFTLQLRDNFRCTPEITKAANHIIGNFPTSTGSHNSTFLKPSCGITPQVLDIPDPILELEFLTDQICQLVCGSAKLSDIAVLTRTNAQLKTVTDHLASYGIPAEKLTTQPDWMNDRNIKFLIDLLKVCCLVYDEKQMFGDVLPHDKKRSDFSVVLTLTALRGVGNQSIQALFRAASKLDISLWDYISNIRESQWPIGVSNKTKVKNYTKFLTPLIEQSVIHQLVEPIDVITKITGTAAEIGYSPIDIGSTGMMKEYRNHLLDMLKTLKLCSLNKPEGTSLVEWFLETYFDQSMVLHQHFPYKNINPASIGTVKVSTIHSSKGLEFPIVFLMGVYNNKYSMEDNVLYVGMTRARNLLYMSNIKHNKMRSLKTNRGLPLLHNEGFWKYYNEDLGRQTKLDQNLKSYKYASLHKKYGITTPIRAYSAMAKCASTACRYIVK